MKKYILKKISEKTSSDSTVTVYTITNYKIRVIKSSSGLMYIHVITNSNERYVPDIFCNDDCNGTILGFDIQTTSYGALNVEETKKMIKSLNEAISVVNILTETFCKKAEDITYYVYMDSPYGTELLGKTKDRKVAEEIKAKKDAEWQIGYLWHTRISETEEKETFCFD